VRAGRGKRGRRVAAGRSGAAAGQRTHVSHWCRVPARAPRHLWPTTLEPRQVGRAQPGAKDAAWSHPETQNQMVPLNALQMRTCESPESAPRPTSTATSALSSRAALRVAPLAGLPVTAVARTPRRCSGLRASFAFGSLRVRAGPRLQEAQGEIRLVALRVRVELPELWRAFG
jgi:hypothetical protein